MVKPKSVQPVKELSRSLLYRELRAECAEIARHKWLESEQVGHDIGYERALLSWIRRHRTEWRMERELQRRQAQWRGLA